jgi:hypothetical protein
VIGPAKEGWLMSPPHLGAPLLIVGDSAQRTRTSRVQRILATGLYELFIQTKNSTYRLTVAEGDERAWLRMCSSAVPAPAEAGFEVEQTGSEWPRREVTKQEEIV